MSRLVDEDSPLAKAWRPSDPPTSAKQRAYQGEECPVCVEMPERKHTLDELARWHRDR